MKKIKCSHSNKDRIICVSTFGQHEFFYQPVGSSDRYRLFEMDFSISIFQYFRKYGNRMPDYGFGLTIGELYRFKAHYNYKLSHLMDLLPGQVDRVLRKTLVEKASYAMNSTACFSIGKDTSTGTANCSPAA